MGHITTEIMLDNDGKQVDFVSMDDTHELENYEIYTTDKNGDRDEWLVDVETLDGVKGWIDEQVDPTDTRRPDDMVCPLCCSEDIAMIGDPEYNDLWTCNDCGADFGCWVERQEFNKIERQG